jgi:hypothetical protein
MNYKQAVKIAVKILEEHRRRFYAIDANMFKNGIVTIRTTMANKEYEKITEAIKVLEEKK